MNPDDDDTLEQDILAHAAGILHEVEAELDAIMGDPLLQDIVDRAVAEQEGLTEEQRADAREGLLVWFATNPRTAGLLEEIRSGGGKSHVVDAGSRDAAPVGETSQRPSSTPTPRRNQGAR